MVFFKKYFDKHLTFNENCVYYNHKRKQGRFGLTEVPFFLSIRKHERRHEL